MAKQREKGLIFYKDSKTNDIYCYGFNGRKPFNIKGMSKDEIFDKAKTYTQNYYHSISQNYDKNLICWVPDYDFVKESFTSSFFCEDFVKKLVENLVVSGKFSNFAYHLKQRDMRTDLLIPTSVRTAIQLEKWIKENGTIAFEHGFKGSIRFQGEIAKLTMIEPNGVHLYMSGTKQQKTIPFVNFTPTTISEIINRCNNYYNYCLTKA